MIFPTPRARRAALSRNYSDRHRPVPGGCALLTRGSLEGRANATNSGLFRRVRDLLETNISWKLPHEGHQFSATISETLLPSATAARIYRSRGGGRGGWNVPTAAGSMTTEAALLLFNSFRANVSTIYRISFVCTQVGSKRNSVSNRDRQFRWHRPY